MNQQERQGFYADEGSLDRDSYLTFSYMMECAGSPREVAAELAREQSTAQWKRPGEDEDYRPRHAARVVSVEPVEESELSAFGARHPEGGRFSRARVRIAHPHGNFGPRLPNLLTAAMGEGAFFTPGVSSIKLLDIEFPDSFLANFRGPRHGTRGIRQILGVEGRPVFFGVVKPNVGLDPASFASIAKQAWLGGLDVAKDDEMLADPGYSPFEERTRLAGAARREAEQETGERKIFLANVTDEYDRMFALAEIAGRNGANALMLNVMAIGLSAVRSLASRTELPIVAHFDCIAPMSRHPHFGVSTALMTKLQRIAGCDAIIMPGFGARMMTPDEEVIANADAASAMLGSMAAALPVPGGSDWAGTLPAMYQKLRTADFGFVPGRGVFGHPDGPGAGAASLRQAWEAVVARVSIEDHARERRELARAVEAFGRGASGAQVSVRFPFEARGFTGAPLMFQRN
ncbi:MAG: ribulose 1,5-bisphosphate carboxylase [Proteobacteria bacterium]|nr:ribulose 1,5-bisphosphate carboxylase [Pseudomonadota bacterium]